ncbi:hypothetical protein ABMA28_006197 [Loxostege sticticalis]|uniref:Uncharacterized protein n=1 Tax=Loxostege sticticalis TaxID=481309 RepID=A0ABD0SKB4_LOXSC
MTSTLWILGMACLVMVQAQRYDRRPQRFQQESPSAPKNQREFVTKDVTLYLTPSQVRALEASREGNQQSGAQELSEQEAQELEEEIKSQLEQQNIYINDESEEPSNEEPTNEEPTNEESTDEEPNNEEPTNEEPIDEEPLVIIPRYQQKVALRPKTQGNQKYVAPSRRLNNQNSRPKSPERYSLAKQSTNEKVQDGNANYKLIKVQRDPLRTKQYNYIPYAYLGDYTTEAQQPEEANEETETPLNVKTFRNPQIAEEPQEEDENQEQNPLNKEKSNPRYTLRYNDQKQRAEYQRFLLRLEKENRAEAISESSSGVRPKAQRRPSSSGNRSGRPWGSQKSLRHYWSH